MMKKRILPMLLAATMSVSLAAPVYASETTTAVKEDVFADNTSESVTLLSPDPDDDLLMKIWLEEGTPYYTVTLNGYNIVEKSKLGLNTKDIGSYTDGFTMGEVQIKDVENDPWKPLVGEYELVEDKYQEAIIPLTNENGTIAIEARVYDTGVAFRYDLPDIPEGKTSYTIGSSDEKTQFAFPENAYAYRHTGQNQSKPSKTSVDNLGSNIFRPMTVTYENGYAMTICEANLDNYGILKLENDSSNPRTAKVKMGSDVKVRAEEEYISNKHRNAPVGPEVSPWRTMIVGESVTDLADHATLAQLLNEPMDEDTYKFSDWVEAGSCQRAMRGDNDDTNVMNNEFLNKMVDAASERGYRYVLLDTGWQGPENDPNCDPRLDPAALDPDNAKDEILRTQYYAKPENYKDTFLGNGEGCFYTGEKGDPNARPFKKYGSLGQGGDMYVNIDIPKLCDYANKKGVGIILYVNGERFFPDDMSGRYRFTPDELFTYFERWGVAGVKPGFVECDSQNNELYMQEVVEAAARHHLVMTVHDKWVPSGIERTYPNLLSAEGIYGDEEKGNVSIPEDISTIFTRTIQSPADHTFCWPGKATKGYALASPLMFRTGLNLLFWYTNTLDIPEKDKPVIDFYDNLPSTWKNTLHLEGKMQEYATIARQSFPTTANDGTAIPSRWYIGSLSAINRALSIPLDFLEDGKYVAEIYFDGEDADPNAGFNSAAKKEQTLLKEMYIVDKDTTLVYNIKAKYGYSVRLTKASDYGDTTGIPSYDKMALQTLVNSVNALEMPYYETAAWNALQEAKTAAQAVLDNEAATEAEVAEAVASLSKAYHAYLPTAPLMDAISGTKRLIAGYYTKDSWAVLDAAVEAGKELLNNAEATESELTAATNAIKAAIDSLVEDLLAEKEVVGYLSDLDFDAEKSWNGDTYNPATGEGNKMDKVCKDKNRAGGEMKLVIDGETKSFAKGLGMDAPGELYYDITDKGYAFFEAIVGVDAERLSKSNGMTFFVYGDGELLKEVSITGDKAPQKISVPIAGVKELLIATDPNGNTNNDWADWADAKFVSVKNSEGNIDFVNVALNKPVEVSTIEKPENDKANINDGSMDTRWAASSGNYPEWAIIDLGEEYDILQFVTNFYHKSGDRYYTFNIYTSNDKENWTLAADESKNTTPGTVKDRVPENTKARYVKLDVTGVNPSGYASVYEFEVIAAVEKPVEPSEPADKADLEALITYAEGQKEHAEYEFLIPAVKKAFEVALTKASEVMKNEKATQTEVDKAYDRLLQMVQMLDFTGNNTALNELVEHAKGLLDKEKLYTKDSWATFKEAYTEALEVLADENALQAELNAAAEALDAAINGLEVIPVDKTKLQKLVDKALKYDLTKYTKTTGDILTGAREEAEILLKGDATQEEIDNAYADLQKAIFGLRLIPDKGQLEELIKGAQAIDTANYTVKSATAFTAALDAARAVFADGDATEEEVKAAEKALAEAKENLVAKADAGEKDNDKEESKVAGNNENSNATSNTKSQPKTGDATQTMAIMAMLMAAVAAVLSLRRKITK